MIVGPSLVAIKITHQHTNHVSWLLWVLNVPRVANMQTEFLNMFTGETIPITDVIEAKKKCIDHVRSNKNITCMNHLQCEECWYAWQDFLE